ncbi:MAG: HipA N-terminal domain-containing protein [Acidobacteriota bacterium]
MRKARVFMHDRPAGTLIEREPQRRYRFEYEANYDGEPVSLSMPLSQRVYEYEGFPPFFDGLLPEGILLESLLKLRKIDRHDYFSQLLAVGADMVGAVTVEEEA